MRPNAEIGPGPIGVLNLNQAQCVDWARFNVGFGPGPMWILGLGPIRGLNWHTVLKKNVNSCMDKFNVYIGPVK